MSEFSCFDELWQLGPKTDSSTLKYKHTLKGGSAVTAAHI